VGSYSHEKSGGLFSNRIEFLFKDLRDREKIVRFVFEEERRIRKKEVGD
jgi:c-di-GMP-binding flagellar brake protein YcgR